MPTEWRKASEPRTISAQEAAIKVLETLSKSVEGTENVDRACNEVVKSYKRTGGQCPVAFSTLRKYADGGIIIVGYPELAQPFLKVVPLVRDGSLDLKALGGGGMSLMVREGALDQACNLARDIMKMADVKEKFANNLPHLTSLIGKLSDVVKLERGQAKPVDLFELLEGINKDEAMKVIEVVFRRFPEIGAALAGK